MATFDFQNYCRTNFSGCPPVSYLLRNIFKDRWFRIHSLPDSKRYAANNTEREEILRRQRLLLKDIIGENEQCIFVCGCYEQSPKEAYQKKLPEFAAIFSDELEPINVKSFAPEEALENDERFFYAAFSERKLHLKELDKVLSAVANWEIVHFFIVNPKLHRIFAPYDGGVDLILETPSARDVFKLKYQDWLSKYPSGL